MNTRARLDIVKRRLQSNALLFMTPRSYAACDRPKRDRNQPDPIRVLVVDDEVSIRTILNHALGVSFPVRVHTASCNTAALRALRRHRTHLVISDLIRPGGDGFAFLERAREQFPHIPVLIVSGVLDSSTRVRVRRLGAAATLPKPFSPAQLVKVVGRLLGLEPAPFPRLER